MLTTVAYQLNENEKPNYAFEGSVAVAGSGVNWLKNNLGIIENENDFEKLASSVNDSAGVCFIPAFSGLYAPHWREDARGLIIGLSHHTNKAHICRALLDAIAYQTTEIVECIHNDSNIKLTELRVDGGMANNDKLMQFQTDLLNIPIIRSQNIEATVLGAAFVAGFTKGLWNTEILNQINQNQLIFEPKLDQQTRKIKLDIWKSAIKRSLNWV
eukprot:TRINITY_DN5690_c0_g1_i2.p2 TRINITY_DN5690_c0_g1~~TRINITY_DN5690_c0_g1_i2.p2  ORF type:complete len:214 (-),score=91.76 TRINITY_DN5690_c0_g1_i2:93-734(-)